MDWVKTHTDEILYQTTDLSRRLDLPERHHVILFDPRGVGA
jgi:hypothetical protein